MATRENDQVSTPRPAAARTTSSDTDRHEGHPTPPDQEEGHLGARENQVSKTPHPTPDDDEPKQG